MTTYEEDIVDIYYKLQGYFTIMNTPFDAIEKRKGGKGRGEIDVLAIKPKDDKIIDAVHVEVGVSTTDEFPWTDNKDTKRTIIKKFFNDSESKIIKLIGTTPFHRMSITSNFNKKRMNRLPEVIKDDNTEVLNFKYKDEETIIEIKHDGVTKMIKIVPFKVILSKTIELFKNQKLEKKNFQDPRYRAIAYMILNDKNSVKKVG